MTVPLLGLVSIAAMAAPEAASAVYARTSSVRFTTPNAGARTTSKVTFTVEVANFEIDAQDVGEAKEGHTGHLHFCMDNGKCDYAKYSGANDKLAELLGTAGKYSPAVAPTITYANLPNGRHTLVAVLVNNDYSPAGPSASVTFTVA